MWRSGSMEQSKGKLMDDFKAVVLDAEELLKVTASQTGERVAEARAKAAESLQAAKARLADAQDIVQDIVIDQAKAAAKETDAYVRHNPWQAAGVAAVVGFVLGALLTRR